MIARIDNSNLINHEYKKYIFKKKIYRYLLDLNYISLEEYEKSIVQLEKKYNSN